MRITILFSLLVSSINTWGLTCSGTVDQLGFHAADTLMVKLSSMNKMVFFCKTSDSYQVAGSTHSTSKETCNTMYSTFLAANMASKNVSIIFDGDDVPAKCDGWADWKHANIRHFKFD